MTDILQEINVRSSPKRIKFCTVEGRTSTKEIRICNVSERNSNDTISQETAPKSYISNTEKEKICLANILDFTQLFLRDNRHLHDRLYITSKNEFGVSKCVCSTIRPELLPFPKLHDIDECSKFVSHYMDYEPLEDPCKPPCTLPSPSQVLKWGVGDSFDLSVLLASFLIGSGRDAYVVYGTAPRSICMRDRSKMTSMYGMKRKTNSLEFQGSNTREEEAADFEELKQIRNYLKTMTNSCDNGVNDSIPISTTTTTNNEVIIETDDEENSINKNVSESKYCHSWVLVKPRLHDPPGETYFFIEPSTGQRYSCYEPSCPYIQIFAMWNTNNYWINKTKNGSMKELDFTTEDVWEPVFYTTINSSTFKSTVSTNLLEIKEKRITFDPPFSWVENLCIPLDSFAFQYPPNGCRVLLYDSAKVELLSEGVHKQGLRKRITSYSDHTQIDVLECLEYFGKNRKDFLTRRIRFPMELSFHECFSPKHVVSLSEWMEISGKRRIIKFRPKGRADCLTCRVEIFGDKIEDTYEERLDGLSSRTIFMKKVEGVKDKRKYQLIFSVGECNQSVVVRKIVEKYKRKIMKNCRYAPISTRVFRLIDKVIESEYYNEEGRIVKESVIIENNRIISSSANCLDIEGQQNILHAEKVTLAAVRNLHQDFSDLVRIHKREEDTLRMDVSQKEGALSTSINEETPKESSEKEHPNCSQINYLSPYLLFVKDKENVTGDEAIQIQNACLKAMKDRLLERANIMQNRLQEENEKLIDIQASYQQDDVNEKDKYTVEEFEQICSEVTFRIKILEMRLREHEDVSIKKYKALEHKLQNDSLFSDLSGR